MLNTETVYVIATPGNLTSWGWSPDGVGMYWYDTMDECVEDNPLAEDWDIEYFGSRSQFDEYRNG